MEKQSIKASLHTELTLLPPRIYANPLPDTPCHTNTNTVSQLIGDAVTVLHTLTSQPYSPARDIARKTGVSVAHIPLIYKLIQRSNHAQNHLKSSFNRDYFSVVNHYFNNKFFTIVFFVGTTCPSRCVYCPNVKTDAFGKRTLTGYGSQTSPRLNKHHIESIFTDLETLKNNGTDILVKISGGLEPLTDITTMEWITQLAKTIHVPTKLFTNGILLNTAERRNTALETHDIRISLSTPDEELYEKICFSDNPAKKKKRALSTLKENIVKLVHERNRDNRKCKIGFNSIIMPDNINQITRLIEMAETLGIDYIDFKPDYFKTYDAQTETCIQEAVRTATHFADKTNLYVNFTGSLSRSDMYWKGWNGMCDTVKQSDYKIFITPYGHCSPVHYGAFPHSDASRGNSLDQYAIGIIDETSGLLEILQKPQRYPKVTLNKLNPFELMLNLEITREEEDKKSGIPLSCSPYHTSLRDAVPETINSARGTLI